MNTVWFACITSKSVGLGHLSRCIALAEEFNSRRSQVCFSHGSRIDSRGIELMNQSGFSTDCSCNGTPTIIVGDSYDSNFLEDVFSLKNCTKLLLVDDISPLIFADFYIEASPISKWIPLNKFASVLKFEKSPLLRQKFDKPISTDFYRKDPSKFLISLGAAKEHFSIVESILRVIRMTFLPNYSVTLIISESDIANFQQLNNSYELTTITKTTDLSGLAAHHDFVISGGGVTAWEFISLGIPGFLIGVVENQREQLNYIGGKNLRNCVFYESGSQLEREIGNLFSLEKLSSFATSGHNFLRNGRIQAVNWIESFSHPHQTN